LKFAIAVNMQRFDPEEDVRNIAAQALKLVQIAEQGGFEVAFAAEHHTIELTIAPSPFVLLTHWADHTSRIRLGTATVVAPYWHPIRLAGEAALFDVLSDGRLELGIARGAYQYEFDRIAKGIPQQTGVAYMKEIVPAVKALWAGDYAHDGEHWKFPTATSVPKPLQKPHPPIWIAARDPGTFDWAIKNGADIMTTPLSRPNSEIQVLSEKFCQALSDNPDIPRPRLLMLRQSFVYEDPADWRRPVEASMVHGRHFENLFQTSGVVRNGFTEPVDLSTVANHENYDPARLRDSLVVGTPDEVVNKLRLYESAGVDLFCYGVNVGLPWSDLVRSLELFIERVMPAFAQTELTGKRQRAASS
jgi:alkanesulfonate monooxygenase SsuD/methylene tetrahydromethanopterin reductase-like flavin-dependent oxidoreductase (luciferase family)